MTSNDFKSLAARELDEVTPMPTVLPDVMAEGARRHRRTRTLRVGLAAAAVGGVIAVGAIGFGTAEDDPGPERSGVLTASNGPETSTKSEFTQWAAERFSTALPDRFGPVRPGSRNYTFVTGADGVRLQFNLNVTLTDWEKSNLDPNSVDLEMSCSDVAPDPCAALPKKNAIAYRGPLDDGGAFAGMEMHLEGHPNRADSIALNFFGVDGDRVPLSNNEILAIVDSPEFEAIWREYTAHPKWVYASYLMGVAPPKGKG